MKTLAIITVVYKNYTVLEEYFASLEKQGDNNFKLFIIDNTEKPEDINLPPYASVVHTKNKGYSAAVNIGLTEAIKNNLSLFTITNSDIIFDKNFVKHALVAFEKHPRSLVGGKIYYAKGFEYHKGRYSKNELGRVLWYAGGHISWEHALTPHRGVDLVDAGQFDQEIKTGFINGCLMLFDKDVYDLVGPWDESYFMYFEDSDYCVSAMRLGVELWFDPTLVVWHKNSQSTGGAGSDFHAKYLKKNQLKFGLKYAPLSTILHLVKNNLFK